MKAFEVRNQFLVEMHELEGKLRPILRELGLSDIDDNLATIVLEKSLNFASRFEGLSFFESLTGSLLMEYFKGLTLEEIEILDLEKKKSFLNQFLQKFLWVGEIPSYLDNCTFLEEASFTTLDELFSELLAGYILADEDITEEKIGFIMACVLEEITTLESEKSAIHVIESTTSLLLEDSYCREVIGVDKILKK